MGFYASRAAAPIGQQRNECLRFLEKFADQRIRLGTLAWLSAAEAPAPVTSTTMKAR
jgi:hypothetical protein